MRQIFLAVLVSAAVGIASAFAQNDSNPCTRPQLIASVMESMNATNQNRRAGLSIVDINNIKEVSNDGANLVCHAEFTTSDEVVTPGVFILHLNKTSNTAYIQIKPDE